MSGAAISSTTRRLQVSPQKLVNQRPTIALLSSCKLMGVLLDCCLTDHRMDPMTFACVACSGRPRTPVLTPVSNSEPPAPFAAVVGEAALVPAASQPDLKARTGV